MLPNWYFSRMAETERDKLPLIPSDTLRQYHKDYLELRKWVTDNSNLQDCEDRIGWIVTELDDRLSEERQKKRHLETSEESQKQHRASFAIGLKTLAWTKAATIAAIVGAVLAAIALLRSPSGEPPTSAPALLASSPKMTTPKPVSPAASSISKASPPPLEKATPSPATPAQKTP